MHKVFKTFFLVLSLTIVPAAAHADDLPAYAHCEYVASNGTIVCFPGTAVVPGVFGFGGKNVYDLCMVYFGNSPAVEGYCQVLAGGGVTLPGAPQFPPAVYGTTFTPNGTPLIFTTDEFCDWLFQQPGGISHYDGLPVWLRNYCETRDPSLIPPGF